MYFSEKDLNVYLDFRCNNKEQCTVNYGFMFGDPCYGTFKYMDVQYRCVSKGSFNIYFTLCRMM